MGRKRRRGETKRSLRKEKMGPRKEITTRGTSEAAADDIITQMGSPSVIFVDQ